MSSNITTAFVQAYHRNVLHDAQQMEGRLYNTVTRHDNVVGKTDFWDRVGQTSAWLKQARGSKTQHANTPHARRRSQLAAYNWSDTIATDDVLKVLIDPKGAYTKAGAAAMGRQWDQNIIDAALGTAATGETGSGSETWPYTDVKLRSHQIAETGTVGFTFDKIKRAGKIFNALEVPKEDRYMLWTAEALEDLYDLVEFKSFDYTQLRAIDDGTLTGTWMGFHWIHSELCSDPAGTGAQAGGYVTSLIAYHKDGLGLSIAGELQKLRIDELPDQNYETQIWMEFVNGAVRVDGDRVIEIQFYHT